uniref:Uncharacterized protein n=1 Tax=Dictyoglomus turgidum TaxID=513050 RepID=A0A7C3SPI8_9BACT
MLQKEAIEEFKKIYKKEFRKELTDKEASQKAKRLLNFYKAVYLASFGSRKNTKIYDDDKQKDN